MVFQLTIMALRLLLSDTAHVPTMFSALVFSGALFSLFTLCSEMYLHNGP